MEVKEINSSKRCRITNGSKIGRQHQDEREEEEKKGEGKGQDRIRPWHHSSSRIFRVSRASGGKDRHSKVLTAKGLRDRRVRLSVSTAIQFYDLQDRLGYDQPSKAVEWLIEAAAAAIAELPSLDTSFPESPPRTQHLPTKDKPIEPDADAEPNSSTSETSKGSVLSLSRSEIRVKARERAPERAANLSQSSFTELLISSGHGDAAMDHNMNFTQKPSTTADYFGQAGIFGQLQKIHHQPASGFSSQTHFGNNSSPSMGIIAGEHLQQFSFFQDHAIPVADYNLNFSIAASGLAGFNRGTLQSNSPSHVHHHHYYNHLAEGPNLPLFFASGAAAPAPASAPAPAGENQFPNGFDGRLQLCYGDDLKGKGKR